MDSMTLISLGDSKVPILGDSKVPILVDSNIITASCRSRPQPPLYALQYPLIPFLPFIFYFSMFSKHINHTLVIGSWQIQLGKLQQIIKYGVFQLYSPQSIQDYVPLILPSLKQELSHQKITNKMEHNQRMLFVSVQRGLQFIQQQYIIIDKAKSINAYLDRGMQVIMLPSSVLVIIVLCDNESRFILSLLNASSAGNL